MRYAVLALALAAGLKWLRRRRGEPIVRILPSTPFPPYDWFAHEQPPEEAYPSRRGVDSAIPS
jgi:hypothetical protein